MAEDFYIHFDIVNYSRFEKPSTPKISRSVFERRWPNLLFDAWSQCWVSVYIVIYSIYIYIYIYIPIYISNNQYVGCCLGSSVRVRVDVRMLDWCLLNAKS